jgi:hypothetical protein
MDGEQMTEFPRWVAGLVRLRAKPVTTYDTLLWGSPAQGRGALIGGTAPQFGCWNATLLDTVQVVAIQRWSLWFPSNASPGLSFGSHPSAER